MSKQPENGACPECGAPFTGEAFESAGEVLACPECDYEYDIPGLAQSMFDSVDMPGEIAKDEISESDHEGIEVDRSGLELAIDVSWFRWVFLLVGGMGLGGLALSGGAFWFVLTTEKAVEARGLFLALLASFSLPWVGLMYVAGALVVNSTALRVGNGALTVEYGPLPWWGESTLDATAIEQVYCTAEGGQPNPSSSRDQRVTYTVSAEMADGRTVAIVEKVGEKIDALAIERELEEWLDIEDRAVPDEVVSRDD